MIDPASSLTDLFDEPNQIREALKAAFGGMNAYFAWWPTLDERGPRFDVLMRTESDMHGCTVTWEVARESVTTWGDVLRVVGQ